MRCSIFLLVLIGCTGDLVSPWQLAHDRIVAIRADPPRIEAGESTTLTVLVAHADGPTSIQPPDSMRVDAPATLVGDRLTAPNELPADAPVPLVLEVEASGFAALTTVWLGDTGVNPVLDGVEIDGQSPADTLEVTAGVDVALRVDADDERSSVMWLSSCGTLHDFDLSHATLHVEPDDPHDGELVLVVRDYRGGTSWHVWPIHAH